jgi:hypothetical protein
MSHESLDPDAYAQAHISELENRVTIHHHGYTKREDMAVKAMCAVLADNPGITAGRAATIAVEATDNLIKELNR